MKLLMTLLVATLLAPLALSARSGQPDDGRRIEIIVLYPDGQRAPGVSVTFRDAAASTVAAVTDRGGRLKIEMSRAGTYQATVRKDGFLPQEVRIVLPTHGRTKTVVPVMLEQGEYTRVLNDLVGVVSDTTGRPLAQMAVCAQSPFRGCEGVDATITDKDGRFQLRVESSRPVVLQAMGRGYFGVAMSPALNREGMRTVRVVVSDVSLHQR